VFWLEQIVLLKASNSFFVDSDDTDFNSGGPRPGKGPQPVPLQFFSRKYRYIAGYLIIRRLFTSTNGACYNKH
jgi:hypothetical protein